MDDMDNPASLPTGARIKNKLGDTCSYVLHVYDEGLKTILQDLTILNSGLTENYETPKETLADKPHNLKVSSSLICNSCSVSFLDNQEQRSHYKSDWHRYNLKQKIKGAPSVSEEKFSTISGAEVDNVSKVNLNKARTSSHKRQPPSALPSYVLGNHSSSDSSESSSSDSDSDWSSADEDANENFKNPKLYFKNGEKKILSIYRCVLYGKRNLPSHDGELIRLICTVQERLMWAIILVGGGRFAAAIFNGKNINCHKTIRRYTIRAKQGTSQSTKDSKQNGPHHQGSAGASLRRHNELALIQDIQALLEQWSDELKKCHCIFYRAPGPNKTILFGGKSPTLKNGDPRLRPIPLATGRSTFQEIQRIHDVLSGIECFCDALDLAALPNESPKKLTPKKIYKGKKSQRTNMPQTLHKSITKQGPPTSKWLEFESSDSEAFYLVEEDEVLNLVNLKFFESTRKARHRSEKMSRNGPAHTSPPFHLPP